MKIDISGSGGVMCGEDVVKYLLVGANNTQVCSAIYLMGYEVIEKILTELQEFMSSKGYETIAEFRGKAIGKILGTDEVVRDHLYVASIDTTECSNCGTCYRSCMYAAIAKREKHHEVILDHCDGCGLCVEVCPTGAARLTRR
jgi:dihydroorotate dehydrogenase (fumarate)